MNFNELIKWAIAMVVGWSAIHHIDDIRMEIWKAQAVLIYESRTETWGSFRIFQRSL